MKIFAILFAVLFLVVMASAAAPKTAAECEKAGGQCKFLTCGKGKKEIGKCDKNGGACCVKE
ncbi:beta-defensin 1-like [Anolis carolinensis]|uniref:beta-defensin 1-like n=1 Tax=Anolis carolinensis TaxID=28377 RepID=UPI002F2B7595